MKRNQAIVLIVIWLAMGCVNVCISRYEFQKRWPNQIYGTTEAFAQVAFAPIGFFPNLIWFLTEQNYNEEAHQP